MHSRRLLQQYAVDMWAKIEGARLDWVRRNQGPIRADKYNGLLDAQANDDLPNAGARVILPPTIYGSPRWFNERFQDAMAIVRKYGKPDLFLTFTCNPKWQEIEEALNEGESYTDRPDLCVRVFKMKLDALLLDLLKRQILGPVKAYTATVEFQKRGLPHAHIVLIMDDGYKPLTPEMVDNIVCAEIPDRDLNPELYKVITSNNIHGPCGNVNINCPCMVGDEVERKCSKNFPKALVENTVLSQQNYPQYKRRSPEDGGNIHQVNRGTAANPNVFHVDNSWVVPYNPFLSLRYKAHINVEVVYSTKCVKYLYKYLTKGQDRIVMELDANNEVEQYQNARYISASEAYWRIYGFELHHRSPPVQKLECHLPGEQVHVFADGEQEQVLEQGPRKTMLEAYFETNFRDPAARAILYPDFPQHYTWNTTPKEWRKRKRGYQVGRVPMVTLTPHTAERFYLRLLLYNKAGATSFDDLKTIDQELCSTFQEACVRLGLLERDDELDSVIEEATTIRFGDQLRDVFINILIYCRPSDTRAFWERHKRQLCEDHVRRLSLQQPTPQIYNLVLWYIQERLQLDGLDLERHFNLPPLNQLQPGDVPRIIREETSYDTDALRESIPGRIESLNDEQMLVYNDVIQSIDNGEGKIFALQASGGTGKTYTLNLVLDTIRSRGEIALAAAMSGIAATLLHNGRTLHSRCGVPINITEHSTCNFTKLDATGKLMKDTKILIIDEVSMGHKYIFEALDRTLRFVRDREDQPFGELTVLFSADWRQCLPVVPRGSRGQIVNSCLKTSYIWQHVHDYTLETNMRVAQNGGDPEFARYLIQCGDGNLPILDGKYQVNIPENLQFTGDIDSMCDWVFEDLENNSTNRQWTSSRAIICPTNKTVDIINNKMMDKFPGEEHLYRSYDTLEEAQDQQMYPNEYINNLTPSGLPPHKLKLKVRAPIMLMRNFNPYQGHCNGTKYIITNLHTRIIEAVVANGPYAGNNILIPRIPLIPSETSFPFRMKRKQFPIRPCFAITSNKSQGQTLQRVGVYLDRHFFSHGAYYVAQSRVGSAANLRVLCPESPATTKNVVYPEVLG